MSKVNRKALKLTSFMNMCIELSCLSHDPKYKVASMIITDDFREICAIGYNGDYKGGPNERVNLQTGMSGFSHSEENCLIHLCKPFELRSNLIMFCTHTPCPMCAKHIVNGGIRRVVYNTEYRDLGPDTDHIFANSNVGCVKFDSLCGILEICDVEFVTENGIDQF